MSEKIKIEFTVFGNPKGLKRHRSFKRGNFIGNYDPSKNDKADFLAMAREHKPDKPLEIPLMLKLVCYFERPKSHYGTGSKANQLKANAPLFYTSTPDADNVMKFVCDALNGIFYKDDKQFAHCSITKKYDEVPRVELTIEELIQ